MIILAIMIIWGIFIIKLCVWLLKKETYRQKISGPFVQYPYDAIINIIVNR